MHFLSSSIHLYLLMMFFHIVLSYTIQDEKNVMNAVSHPIANNLELKSESSKIPVVSVASATTPTTRAVLPSESMDFVL